MSVSDEFVTIEAILATRAETRGVDAFSLSVIKAERQLRKLFTNLVFHSRVFTDADVPELRRALGANKRVYYNGFIVGLDLVSPAAVSSLVGAEHDRLRLRLSEAVSLRNKIFHGQLTDRYLTRDELLEFVSDIRVWCDGLATGSLREVGYDGFARNSFQKQPIPNAIGLRREFASVDDYRDFISTVLMRAPR